jgi:hypothetical protein
MTLNYTLSLSNIEVDQLLKILYYQQVVADETAINLIAQINRAIHERNAAQGQGKALTSRELDLSRVAAAETYHRYRSKRLQQITQPGSSAEGSKEIVQAANAPGIAAIARSLDAIATYLIQNQQLGFGITPGKRMIYCDSQQGWYYLNEQQQAIPIVAPALTCRVQFLEFRQHQQNWKTHCHVQADRPYCLESDYNSPFSKALLLAIASLTPEQLQHPLTIEALQSSDPPGLTCRVYISGTQVLSQFGKTPKWKDVARQAVQHVEVANGRSSQKLSVA